MSDATRERFVVTIERSDDEQKLDEKILAANERAHAQSDPWAKFRASLSIGRGIRTRTI